MTSAERMIRDFIKREKIKESYGFVYHRDYAQPIMIRNNFQKYQQMWQDYNNLLIKADRDSMYRFLKKTNGGLIVENDVVMKIKDISLMIPVWKIVEDKENETPEQKRNRVRETREKEKNMLKIIYEMLNISDPESEVDPNDEVIDINEEQQDIDGEEE